MLKIKFSEFAKGLILMGLLIAIVLFCFAFAATMYMESGKTTMLTVDMYANAALRSLAMSVICAVVVDWIVGSKNQA